VTTAKWNAAANVAEGNIVGRPDKTRQTSYGAQAEIWF